MRKLKSNLYFFALIVAIVSVVFCRQIIDYSTRDTVTITVTKTERVNTKDGKSRYMVYTTDETFRNEDSFIYMKFDSSDVYGQLKVGYTYEAEVYGFRWNLISSYRNIIEVTEQ